MTQPADDPPTALTVRRLHIDLTQPFGREWNRGHAFLTAFMNALSMSFPVGEQFFIDAVKAGAAHLPDAPEHTALRQAARIFVGQEATHRHLHTLYNRQLSEQGLVNHWHGRALRRIERLRSSLARQGGRRACLAELAVTAAYEHFTAMMAEEVLGRIGQPGDWLAHAEPTPQLLWRWHAAEEAEHKSVAFDLYTALGGHHRGRVQAYLMVMGFFCVDATQQTFSNLYRSGQLFRPTTWGQGLGFLWGRHGVVWSFMRPTLAYLRPGFHPGQHGSPALADNWLKAHAEVWKPVGQAGR